MSSSPMGAGASGLRIRWHARIPDTDRKTARTLAEFLARIVGEDPAYISHGEYLEGLSPDGRRWADDLASRYRRDIRAILTGKDKATRLLEARGGNEVLLGLCLVARRANGAETCWIVEDMAVPREARDRGVGSAMMAFITAEARKAGAARLMLESGAANHAAHRLFDRLGFRLYSKVFVRDL